MLLLPLTFLFRVFFARSSAQWLTASFSPLISSVIKQSSLPAHSIDDVAFPLLIIGLKSFSLGWWAVVLELCVRADSSEIETIFSSTAKCYNFLCIRERDFSGVRPRLQLSSLPAADWLTNISKNCETVDGCRHSINATRASKPD